MTFDVCAPNPRARSSTFRKAIRIVDRILRNVKRGAGAQTICAQQFSRAGAGLGLRLLGALVFGVFDALVKGVLGGALWR